MRIASSAIALFAIACGSSTTKKSIDAAPDSATSDAAALTWDSVDPISNDGQVITERVSYHVGTLRIYARICRPNDSGAHDVIIYNHGGYAGLDVDPFTANCAASAQAGYVWIASSYRGEDSSDGSVELCLGEVDDVLRMIDIALAQPYANAMHVLMYGGSHGGCVTLRALERGAPVNAAIDIYGPTDWAALDRFWRMSGTNTQFAGVLEQAVGGTPDQVPAAYLARSPLYFLGDVPPNVPLLLIHGTADTIVPYVQTCNVAAALGAPSYHLDSTQQTTATPPANCASLGIAWQSTARPTPSWPGKLYFVAYDGLQHADTTTTAAQAMQQDVATFAFAKL